MSTIKGFVQNERIEIRENNGRSVCNFDICVSEGAQYKAVSYTHLTLPTT